MSRNTKTEFKQAQFHKTRQNSIFEFFDGVKLRKIDSWKVLLEVEKTTPIAVALGGSNGVGNVAEVVKTFRNAMKVPEWTEENEAGLTDGEMLVIINEFVMSVNDSKKATKPQAISPKSTGLLS